MENVFLTPDCPDGTVHLKMQGDLTGSLACRTRTKLEGVNIYKLDKILIDFEEIDHIYPVGIIILGQKLADLRIKDKIELVGLSESYKELFRTNNI